jgi:hypothetical protein
MSDNYLEYAYDEAPRYEKRRRPERCSATTAVRRALLRSPARSAFNPVRKTSGQPSGFHRRIVKKPFYGMG